jgi:broad specificity phosphatase PhoE
VLVVTHGAILRYMLACMIYKEKLDRSLLDPIFKTFRLHNTGITHCTFGTDDESKPKRWRVINWNDVSHLEDLEDSLENNSNSND